MVYSIKPQVQVRRQFIFLIYIERCTYSQEINSVFFVSKILIYLLFLHICYAKNR